MKQLLLIPTLLTAALVLSSCGKTTIDKEIVTQTKYTERKIPKQAPPKAVDMPDVEWFVVNEDNLEEAMQKIKDYGGSVTFLAITPKGYENLAIGIGDLRRYILQQKEIIAYYEKAIDPPKDNDETPAE